MDAAQFGNFIMELRDAKLSRPDMAAFCGYHANTIKAYEKDGRLPDVDYLAALAKVTEHPLADLIAKRLSAGKFAEMVDRDHLFVAEDGTKYKSEPVQISTTWTYLQSWVGDTKGDLVAHLENSSDMAPFIEPGSQTLIDLSDRDVKKGGVFLLELMGQFVIRFIKPATDNQIRIETAAPGGLPMAVSIADLGKLQVKGRVVAVVQKLDV